MVYRSFVNNNMTIENIREALWSIICHCGSITCENCPYKECLREKAIDMYDMFVDGAAKYIGIEYDKPFKVVHDSKRNTIIDLPVNAILDNMEFVLKENDGIVVKDGSGDTFNIILDLLLKGQVDLVAVKE